jgi:DNA polymerase-3 subunit delta'
MSVWDELVGQPEAVQLFQSAAASETVSALGATESSMTHSWLVTGPPGSGRSNLAYAFAAALLCRNQGCGTCSDCKQVAARTHPDLATLTTERVIISIDEVRALVQSSQYSPSISRYRVVIIEDADRMAERTSNVLLKALEEPPERTVWILCAPSEADLIPTIRSRVRSVRLRVPSIKNVAELLVARDGVSHAEAERAARHAQSHIGMAHRLATNAQAAHRRAESIDLIVGMRGVHDAVMSAARLLEIATDDAKALTEERDAEELEHTRRSMGLTEGDNVPTQMRSAFKQLEEQQKRRATRSLRDGLDRILVDLMSVYRDVVRLQLGVETDLINAEELEALRTLANARSSADTLATIEAINLARTRLASNVAPALVLESTLISAVRRSAA